jgi:hypothetical protein
MGSLMAVVALWAPGIASAMSFAEAPGSPYLTTGKPYTPAPGGLLGGETVGDFNGDGLSDVAVTTATGVPPFSPGESVSILLGTLSGGLTLAEDSPIGLVSGGIFATAGAITTDDFNGDGDLDLAVVGDREKTVMVLLGDGAGHFHPFGSPLEVPRGPVHQIVAGDFNGDGKQDLAFDGNEEVNIMLGNGSGGFSPAPGSPLQPHDSVAALATGDFDDDGHSDLAVVLYPGREAVYLGASNGSMLESATSSLSEEGHAIAAADLNNDGSADLAVSNVGAGSVTVLLSDGEGDFDEAPGSPFQVPGGTTESPGLGESIAVADFDGDGNPDVAVANFNGSSDNVAVLQGDGHGAFTNASGSPFPAKGNPRPMAIGDFGGDGRQDLSVVNSFQGVVSVLQNTTPQDSRPVPPPTEHPKGGGGGGGKMCAADQDSLLAWLQRGLASAARAGIRVKQRAGRVVYSFPFRAIEGGEAVFALSRVQRVSTGHHLLPLGPLAWGHVVFAVPGVKTVKLRGKAVSPGGRPLTFVVRFKPSCGPVMTAQLSVVLRGASHRRPRATKRVRQRR